MNLLLTGFEPFNGSPINPSEQVVSALSGQNLSGFNIRAVTLPVDQYRGPDALLTAVQRHQPAAIICLGEAAGRPVVSIERIAVNLQDFRIPDNSGNWVEDKPVVLEGPAAYFSTLPVRAIVSKLHETGIPAEISLSAGTYLCNLVFYTLLHHLTTQALAIPAGFIHLPSLPAQIPLRDRPGPSMALETSLQAIRTAIQVTAASLGLLNGVKLEP